MVFLQAARENILAFSLAIERAKYCRRSLLSEDFFCGFKFTFYISPKLKKGEDFCDTLRAQIEIYYCFPLLLLKWGGNLLFTQGGNWIENTWSQLFN